MKKIPIVAGNWKMNKTLDEGIFFVGEIQKRMLDKEKVKVIFCPPFTALFNMKDKLDWSFFGLAAQNMHWEESGAFTGEISVNMLKSCGVDFVILGHSERRHIFGETNAWVNKKVAAALSGGLCPILCIGETLDERNAGKTGTILSTQLKEGLWNVDVKYLDSLIIAYEPVWAIGTGVTATAGQVKSTHKMIREIIVKLYPGMKLTHIPILYGGSVKTGNAKELIQTPGVDGFLIGGASLEIESFCSIIDAVKQYY